MADANTFGMVVLPSVTHFALPRALAKVVLQIGETLLLHDPTTGAFVARQPNATRIAEAIFPGDPAAAQAWLESLVAEYNKYVDEAIATPGNVQPYFIP